MSTVWTRVRRVIWSWFPWAAVAVYLVSRHDWWWAAGVGAWSAICSLSSPTESPPQFGLDHGMKVGSPEFMNTRVGAAGVPLNNRTHRKSLIVDGRIGFTGGAGIADHWTGDAHDDQHWRDLQIRIEGPAVQPLQTGFAQNWLECTGELVTGPDFYPTLKPAGTVSLQTVMSSPETGTSTVRVIYCLAISAARHSIEIANPYFVPDHLAIDLFRDAVKRGVRVRIMVAGAPNDNKIARLNSIRLYGALLEVGVELLEYHRTMMHHKTMVVDGLWATVGTTNFDNRSFAHNEESNVCLCDEDFSRELNEMFADDVKACEPVNLKAWRSRPLLDKALQGLASFVQDQV